MFYELLESRELLSALPWSAPPSHVVVVIEENHSYNPILGKSLWPPTAFPSNEWQYVQPLPTEEDRYIRRLALTGAIFTDSHAITHPSEPNYLALLSGSTQGFTSDVTPGAPLQAPNLAGELIAAGRTFTQYSESLPYAGYAGGDVGNYVLHHNPAAQFSDVPARDNQPFSAFPRRFSQLPTVSFVTPNLVHDMHSGFVSEGDRWLKQHLGAYARWARGHNSLLIVTWDESGSDSSANQIPTFFVGAHVRRGQFSELITHFSITRTLEEMYSLAPTGEAAHVEPIADVFRG